MRTTLCLCAASVTLVSSVLNAQFQPQDPPAPSLPGGDTNSLQLALGNTNALEQSTAACQWYFTPDGGSEYNTGTTGTTFTIDPVNCANRGCYRARITDMCGAVGDSTLTLSVDGCQSTGQTTHLFYDHK